MDVEVQDALVANGRVQAIKVLREELTDAAAAFVQDKEKGKEAVLRGFIRFVSWMAPDDQAIMGPILALAREHNDRVSPARQSTEMWLLKARIAVALDTLMDLGVPEERAARDLAKVLDAHKIQIGRDRPDNPV